MSTRTLLLALALTACSKNPTENYPSLQTAAAVTTSNLRVDSPARTSLLAVGDPAPRFHATTSDGHAIDVTAAARPRVLVVYFYPRDETPGCLAEATAFRDAHQVYEQANADVIGVSTDTDESHRAFTQHHSLTFSLISDPQGHLAGAFGVPVQSNYASRTTFVIDRHGHVSAVFSPVQVQGHADQVLAAVRAAH